MRIVKVIWFMVLILIVFPSGAQYMPDTVFLREVDVLAKRRVAEAGLSITRPDSLQKASMLTADLSEMLSEYTSVFIKTYGRGSVATASFRGAAATHTKIYWNGMNINSPMNGNADLSLMPVFFTDGVYLLHGGSSMTKGSGALGGSIHLDNVPSWNTKFGLEGLAETASFRSRKAFLNLAFGGKQFQSSTRFYYETSDNSFPFYNSGVVPGKKDTLRNAGYFKTGLLQEVYIRHYNDNLSSFRLWYQTGNRNLPQLMSYQGSDREEHQKDKQFRAQYEWKRYTEEVNYHFFSGINKTLLDYYRATPEFDFVNYDSESSETGFLNHLRIFRQFDEKTYATVTFDANYYQVEASDNIKGNGYKKDRLETSLMLNMHLKPVERFALFLLLRSETYDENMVPLIPAAGFEWQPSRNLPLVLRTNLARNYHKPTLNDLYWIPGGNPELLPEDGYTGDVSLSAEIKDEGISFSNEFTGFVSRIDNWIAWQPAASGAFYWEAGNIKDVFSRGLEYKLSTKVERGSLIIRGGGNYSYTRTSNLNAVSSADDSRGKQLIYIPKHKGGAYVGLSWHNFTCKFDVNGVGKRYTKSSNQESDFEQILNPYLLARLTAEKQVNFDNSQFRLKFAFDNLFNQNYQSILWRPMPGRVYSLALAFKFSTSK